MAIKDMKGTVTTTGMMNKKPVAKAPDMSGMKMAKGPSKKGIMKMASLDGLEEEYEKYIFDLLEQRPGASPMSFEEFRRMVKSGQG